MSLRALTSGGPAAAPAPRSPLLLSTGVINIHEGGGASTGERLEP